MILRERAYQIFGAEFLDNLLEVNGGHRTSCARERLCFRAARSTHLARCAISCLSMAGLFATV